MRLEEMPLLKSAHRRCRSVTLLLAGVLLGAACAVHAEESVWSKRRVNRDTPTPAISPIAGEYKCFTIAMGAGMVTPYGASPSTTPMPSAIDRLELDGTGNYRHPSGKGRYTYEHANGNMIFASGPLKGWTTRSETDGAKPWLRFAAKLGASLAPTSRLGDHICSLQ
jgi:hypothetical protein